MFRVWPKFLYIFASVVCLSLIFCIGVVVINHNTQGAQCDIYLWQKDDIVGKINFQSWFNWFWNGAPCRITAGAVFGIYLWAIPLYWLLREIGTKLWKISKTGRFMVIEYLLWLIVYYVVLMMKTISNQISVTWHILYNAGMGSLVLSLPLLAFIIMIILAENER